MMKLAILITNILILALLVYVAVLVKNPPREAYYFATSSDGRLESIIPLSAPYVSKETLDKWVRTAVGETLSLSPEKYIDQMRHAARFFTAHGWEDFTRSSRQNNLLEHLSQATCSNIRAEAKDIVVESEGMRNGRYEWNVSVKMEYESSCDLALPGLIKMLLVRSTHSASPEGVAIDDWEPSYAD